MAGESKPGGRGFQAFLKSHPVLLLLLLTPGIPEYLSSSSAINAIVLNPPMFVFQIVANLGLYGPGALLIHDARVRWKKGWATILLLGVAYGILEEGVALSTLFNPNAGPVGSLGAYGHWLGVNWVWLAGVVPFHAAFSVSLPILLLGLALPETVDKSLLSKKKTVVVSAILVLDVFLLMVLVNQSSGYWMGSRIFILSLLAIGGLVWAARRVSPEALVPPQGAQGLSNRALASIGISFFPVAFLAQALGEKSGLPAAVDFFLVLAVQAFYLVFLSRRNWRDNQRGAVVLGIGLIVPIAVFGVLAELTLPMTLLADLAAFMFFRRLLAKYRPSPASV